MKPLKGMRISNPHLSIMHRNLKFILRNPLNGKYAKPFKKKDDIIKIITLYREEDEL